MRKGIVLLLLCLYGTSGFSNTDKQLWFGYMHQGRVARHWGYWVDIHHRLKNDFAKNLHTDIVRVGATWFAKDNLRVTVGYAYAAHFPSLTNMSFVRSEQRPWQQVQYIHSSKHFRAAHQLRSEQRFLPKTSGENILAGHHFRQRFRYNYMVVFLFNHKEFKQGSVGLVLNDEVFVNAYSSDKVKAFDQNRAFAGLCYQLTDALQLQLGYLNVFSFTPKGNEIAHGIRLFAFHTIDWRKKK
ncbi:MAG: DUF2490 domain-containing protein [Bacteroidota bacterium]